MAETYIKQITPDTLEIPVGTFKLPERACENNMEVKHLIVPGHVRAIGESAFANCKKLTDITFESGIERMDMGRSVFAGCTSLKAFVGPDTLEKLGTAYVYQGYAMAKKLSDVLASCPSLKLIKISDVIDIRCDGIALDWTWKWLTKTVDEIYQDGNEFDFVYAADFNHDGEMEMFISMRQGTHDAEWWSLTPELYYVTKEKAYPIEGDIEDAKPSLLQSGDDLFFVMDIDGCKRVFGGGEKTCYELEEIPADAFVPADSVVITADEDMVAEEADEEDEHLILPENTEYIPIRAYEAKAHLKEVTFPVEIKKIDNFAFTNCANLEQIHFNPKMQKLFIGNAAFSGCTSLKGLEFPKGMLELNGIQTHKCEQIIKIIGNVLAGDTSIERISINSIDIRCKDMDYQWIMEWFDKVVLNYYLSGYMVDRIAAADFNGDGELEVFALIRKLFLPWNTNWWDQAPDLCYITKKTYQILDTACEDVSGEIFEEDGELYYRQENEDLITVYGAKGGSWFIKSQEAND